MGNRSVQRDLHWNDDMKKTSTVLACAVFAMIALMAGAEGLYKKPYKFGSDWFSSRIPNWEKQLAHLKGKPGLNYLEVGPYEGRSFLWVLDNVLTHPSSKATAIDIFAADTSTHYDASYEARFRANVARSGAAERVTIIKGSSQDELRALATGPFDVIYIDGSHAAEDVLADTVLAWPLLKEGGIMIFDDYTWHADWPRHLRPNFAISAFINAYNKQVELLHHGYQLFVKKRSDRCKLVHYEGCSYVGSSFLYDWREGGGLIDARTMKPVQISDDEKQIIQRIIRSRRPGYSDPVIPEDLLRSEGFLALKERIGLEF